MNNSQTTSDPTKHGYQLLYNYDSIYWRALIGRDAWSLYEVLKSFCHAKENVDVAICTPSLTLLCEILGYKDRRPLLGYERVVKGKTYTYQGLLPILSQNNLVVVHTIGDDTNIRYEFEVILHPTLLTSEQISQLPKSLQARHAALLQTRNSNRNIESESPLSHVSQQTSTDSIIKQIWYTDANRLEMTFYKNEKDS